MVMKKIIFVLLITLSNITYSQLFIQPNNALGTTEASYLYADDTFIFVEEDIELHENTNIQGETSIILRNEAQLIQGDGNGSNMRQKNKGSGNISIYQEGTVNAWDYNVWTSPVGISYDANGIVEIPGNGRFAFKDPTNTFPPRQQQVFYVPTDIKNSNLAIAVGGFDGTTTNGGNLHIASYWLWTFRSGVDYADWFHIAQTGELEAGYAFTMKGINGIDTIDAGDGVINNDGNLTNGLGQRYDFRGRPNNGTIQVEIGASRQTLVGNPYPSALDLDYFLLQNSGSGSFDVTDFDGNITTVNRSDIITGTAFFWDSNPYVFSHFLEDYEGGYGTYSPILSLGNGMYVNATFYMYDENGTTIPGSNEEISQTAQSYDRRFSPVGQGFLLEGSDTQTGGNLASFTNNQRIFVQEGYNSDFKNNLNEDAIPAIGVTSYYPDVNNVGQAMPRLKIGVAINDTYSRELGIVLHEYATSDYDVAGDAKNDILQTDVSFSINGDKGYIINAVPQEEEQFIDITINAAQPSEFIFNVHYIENFNYTGVYLLDSLTNTYHDILNDRIFISLGPGEYEDRFYIRFIEKDETENDDEEGEENDEDETENDDEEGEENDEDETENDDEEGEENDEDETENDDEEGEENDEDETENDNEEGEENDDDSGGTLGINDIIDNQEGILTSFKIYQNNQLKQLEIHNTHRIALENTILFDITGKQIFKKQNLENQDIYIFPTSNLSTGIYIVQFTTQNGFSKARKISITN